jgi:hypothetical protein
LGIVDGVFVVVVREVVEIARGVSKRDANRALEGVASLSLACALGIAGGCFDTATWPDAAIPQKTCDVRHITKVWEWALENYHGAKGLTVDVRDAPVADVFAKLLPHAQQLISGGRGRMAASMGLDIEQVDQELLALRAENERARVATKTLETQLQQAHCKYTALEAQVEEQLRATTKITDKIRRALDDRSLPPEPPKINKATLAALPPRGTRAGGQERGRGANGGDRRVVDLAQMQCNVCASERGTET